MLSAHALNPARDLGCVSERFHEELEAFLGERGADLDRAREHGAEQFRMVMHVNYLRSMVQRCRTLDEGIVRAFFRSTRPVPHAERTPGRYQGQVQQ